MENAWRSTSIGFFGAGRGRVLAHFLSESATIAACLSRLMGETGASYIMLLDRAGQVLRITRQTSRQYASIRQIAQHLKVRQVA